MGVDQGATMDVPLIDQGAQPVAAEEEAPVVREVPSRGERLKYDFDVWYGSSESAEIVILVWVNIIFLFILFSGDYEHDAGTGTDAAKQELNDNGLDWEGVGVEDCEALTNMTLAFCETDPIFYGKLASGRGELDENPVNLWEYDSILVLTEGHRGQEGLTSDSRTMITTLLCRHIQKECAEEGRVTFRGNNPTTSFVIPEISDPRTSALLGLAKAQDFIVSGDLISMALGQMSEEADIHQLLADLFSPEGNEMHIKDVRLYVTAGETLSFWEIMNRARQRCEVAVGYFRPGMAEPIINPGSEDLHGDFTPDKSERITWRSGDQIVVIAED